MKDTCSKTKKKSAGPVVKEIEICSINYDGDVARFVENNGEVVREYWKAREKHPKFVDHFFRKCEQFDIVAFKLDDSRRILRQRTEHGCANFEAVLECEMWEAIEAYANGKLAHAKQELAQCAAVCLRAMDFIDDEMMKKKGKRK